MLAILDNSGEPGYNLKHNDLWTGTFRLPTGDQKNVYCQAHNLVKLPDGPRNTGLYRIVGMPSGEITAMGSFQVYTLEHVMATLLDDILFGYHEVGGTEYTTRMVMEYILAHQGVRRWQLGEVEFSDEYQYHFENVSLLSALLSLGEVLTEEYTWDFDTSTTPWTVNLRKADNAPGCGIYYGRNLVGIEKTMDASALVTRLYPLGYGEGVNQLTIKSVNGGTPYIDADTAAVWGTKCSVWTDTRIEDAATLLAKARQVLEGYKNPYITYTAKAIDLYQATGFSWDNFMPGKLVRVMDREHGVTFQARIVEISKQDTQGDPGKIEITIANAPRDAADSINALANRVGIGELYSQGATNLFALPFADNADENHPAKMRVFISSGMVRINQMLLSWQLAPFRAYETGAASGGSTEQTSSSGGGNTYTSSSGGGNTYTSSSGGGNTYTSSTKSDTTATSTSDGGFNIESGDIRWYGLAWDMGEVDENGKIIELYIPPHSLWQAGHTHDVTIMGHSHNVTIPDHSHYVTIPNHSHNVEIPSHTHNVAIPAHTHDIVYGIYEGGTARNVTIKVDGNTVPASLLNNREIDVTAYLAKDTNGKITRNSWHEIQIIPNQLTRIEANLFAQCFIQSVGGGDY